MAAALVVFVGDELVEVGEHGTLYSSFFARHALNEFTGDERGRMGIGQGQQMSHVVQLRRRLL